MLTALVAVGCLVAGIVIGISTIVFLLNRCMFLPW